jgi:hypothetical protein
LLVSEDVSVSTATLTIMRDAVDLGNTLNSTGLAVASEGAFSASSLYMPVGITITDAPGDTNPHEYRAHIRSTNSSKMAFFPSSGIAYLLLEEIHL